MAKYSIGVDYGSLSGRAVLVEVASGKEIASAIYAYPHAVMDNSMDAARTHDNTFFFM